MQTTIDADAFKAYPILQTLLTTDNAALVSEVPEHMRALNYQFRVLLVNTWYEERVTLTLLEVLALYGNFAVIQALAAQTNACLAAAVQAHQCRAVHLAARNGHLTLLKVLLASLDSDVARTNAVKANQYLALREAARNGAIETLEYMLGLLDEGEESRPLKLLILQSSEMHLKMGMLTFRSIFPIQASWQKPYHLMIINWWHG